MSKPILGIAGYTQPMYARPGETIALKSSTEDGSSHFTVELLRLIRGSDPTAPEVKAHSIDASVNGRYPAGRQDIVAGSYIRIAHLPEISLQQGITIAALVRPTLFGKTEPQAILSGTGFELVIDGEGRASICVGTADGKSAATAPEALKIGMWHLLVAIIDPARHQLAIHKQPVGGIHLHECSTSAVENLHSLKASLPSGPLIIAAAEVAGVKRCQFDGRIEAPAIYIGRPTDEEIARLRHPFDLALPAIAKWDFSRKIEAAEIIDISGNHLNGVCVNLPTRGVAGYAWRGETTRWSDRPELYGAIHFHQEDLADANWRSDLTWVVPEDLRTGIYAFKLKTDHGAEDIIPFFVLPPKGRTTADLVFLASTFTYLAYANSHHGYEDPLAEPAYGSLLTLSETDLVLNERREFGISLYDRHLDDSGGCYSTGRRPILNMRPVRRLWNFNADLHVIDWLEAKGIAYDVVTDHALHIEGPDLICKYRCLMTGTHPEYHTTATLDALETFLQRSGRLFYPGGNGFYWRVATSDLFPDVIEVRRGEAGTRCFEMPAGERYNQFDGEFGGLWRSNGRPPQALFGVGFVAEGFDSCSYFVRDPGSFDRRVAFIFEGVGPDERIGDFGALGGAAGLELDGTDATLGTPAHALVLAHSVEHGNIYLLSIETMMSTDPRADGTSNPDVRAELVFFETPSGGAVFSTGSISWASALAHSSYQNNVSRISENVLRRFLDPQPFVCPVAS